VQQKTKQKHCKNLAKISLAKTKQNKTL